MPSLTFLDANVPIYAAGRPHALKEPCLEVLTRVAERPQSFITDAEVLQELLHRYLALHRWPQGRDVLVRFSTLMGGRIEPDYAADVEVAASLAGRQEVLSARDLLHAAIMRRVGATRIISADQGFDQLSDLQRLDPADVALWIGQVQ